MVCAWVRRIKVRIEVGPEMICNGGFYRISGGIEVYWGKRIPQAWEAIKVHVPDRIGGGFGMFKFVAGSKAIVGVRKGNKVIDIEVGIRMFQTVDEKR